MATGGAHCRVMLLEKDMQYLIVVYVYVLATTSVLARISDNQLDEVQCEGFTGQPNLTFRTQAFTFKGIFLSDGASALTRIDADNLRLLPVGVLLNKELVLTAKTFCELPLDRDDSAYIFGSENSTHAWYINETIAERLLTKIYMLDTIIMVMQSPALISDQCVRNYGMLVKQLTNRYPVLTNRIVLLGYISDLTASDTELSLMNKDKIDLKIWRSSYAYRHLYRNVTEYLMTTANARWSSSQHLDDLNFSPIVEGNEQIWRIMAFLPKCKVKLGDLTTGNDDALRNFSKTSVLFVSISFIILMVISLAWLVFYYVQRFRYAHAKDRLARRLFNAARKVLAKIPTKNVKANDRELESDCPVCIEPYMIGDCVRILPCHHFFHKTCVDPWLLEHRTCPMCKMDILKAFGFNLTCGETGVPVGGVGGSGSSEHVSSAERASVGDSYAGDLHNDPFYPSPSSSPPLVQQVVSEQHAAGFSIIPLTVHSSGGTVVRTIPSNKNDKTTRSNTSMGTSSSDMLTTARDRQHSAEVHHGPNSPPSPSETDTLTASTRNVFLTKSAARALNNQAHSNSQLDEIADPCQNTDSIHMNLPFGSKHHCSLLMMKLTGDDKRRNSETHSATETQLRPQTVISHVSLHDNKKSASLESL